MFSCDSRCRVEHLSRAPDELEAYCFHTSSGDVQKAFHQMRIPRARPLPRRSFGMGVKTVQRGPRPSWVFVVSVILLFFARGSLGACTFCQHVGLQQGSCGKLPVELPVITGGGPHCDRPTLRISVSLKTTSGL